MAARGAGAGAVVAVVAVAALAGPGVSAAAVAPRRMQALDTFLAPHPAPGPARALGSDHAVEVYPQIEWRRILAN